MPSLRQEGISLAVQWLSLPDSSARSLGLIPGQETRSHMQQVCMLQLKDPHRLQLKDHECCNEDQICLMLRLRSGMGKQIKINIFLKRQKEKHVWQKEMVKSSQYATGGRETQLEICFLVWSSEVRSRVFTQQRSELIKADKTAENDRKEEEKRTSSPKRTV